MRKFHKDSPLRFMLLFLVLFGLLYYFNIFFFGVTSPGKNYNAFLDSHLNYIRLLRHSLLAVTKYIINLFGFTSITNDYQLLVVGRGTIDVVYTCLGLGVMSFFAAFVLAYPKQIKVKLLFLMSGLLCIQILNVLRFILLALVWDKRSGMILDHHTIFNVIIYVLIAVSLYFWVKHDDHQPITSAKN